ncbi:MAG TPA: S41 family peptidase [Verrucomicrobiales bacterium]|nr:S41 family peptidase [Verrucomicrobiales bacterium]
MIPLFRSLFLRGTALLLALAAVLPASAQEEAPGKGAETRDFYGAGVAAARRGEYKEAAELLKQIKPEDKGYARGMALLAFQVYGNGLNRWKEGLPYAEKALKAAPRDSEVAYAFVRANVAAGVLFDDKDIARERPKTVAKEFAFLVSKPKIGDTSKKYPRKALEADLDYLEHVLTKCFAYLELRKVDYRGALDAIRISLDDEMPVNTFGICLTKLISLFGDGHASVFLGRSSLLPGGFAPYIAASDRGRVYLVAPSGEGFLDPKHPYVTAIDGRPIADWMQAAGYLVVKGSPQWHLRGSLEMMAYVTYLRGELGLPQEKSIALKLESEDRKDTAEMKVEIQARPARRPDFPRGDSRIIDDIGYLRLSRMTSSGNVLSELDNWMSKFRGTKGLILDVRGNTGGTKNILHTLFPYFMKPGAPMRFVEATSYRLPLAMPCAVPGGFAGSSMSGQSAGSTYWKTDEDRAGAAAFIKQFHPAWTPPAGKFSEWHVMGLDSKLNPDAYYYDKPLIVLQDSSTFSAGDIFVGAFEDHPNTTQMGAATGGGNGKMESYRLPNTGLGVVLCWSAKYRGNGQLYDGVGISPDIVMEATPQDYFGKSDTVLDAAVQRLKK